MKITRLAYDTIYTKEREEIYIIEKEFLPMYCRAVQDGRNYIYGIGLERENILIQDGDYSIIVEGPYVFIGEGKIRVHKHYSSPWASYI
jgi:hypothetical protein